MGSGVLSASRAPVQSSSRYAVMDFIVHVSLRLKVRFSEAPRMSVVLYSGKVPLFRYGPAAWKSLAQRGSSIMGTEGWSGRPGGGTAPSVRPGQPASRLATRGKVAASLMAANTSGVPFSSDLA